MLRTTSAALLLFLLSPRAEAQSEPRDSSNAGTSGIYPLPILFYTPETGTAFGAAALYLHHAEGDSRASTFTSDIIYTTKKQMVLESDADWYFSRGMFRLLAYLKFQRYPNKFFGIGNNTLKANEESYTPQVVHFNSVFYRTIVAHLNAGPAVRFEDITMKETDPVGRLSTGTIAGSRGGTLVGVGVTVNWDSRDNTIASREGGLYQISSLFYRSALGSDFSFTDIQFDTRNFFEVASDQILALQVAGELQSGTAPFQYLARFGGQNLLRGYYEGRFRDKHMVAIQAEYRIPVWWRIGLVGFAGAAQVADQISHFGLKRFWVAGGAGIRFAWNPEERLNLRLDFGFGNNSDGFYITATEAF